MTADFDAAAKQFAAEAAVAPACAQCTAMRTARQCYRAPDPGLAPASELEAQTNSTALCLTCQDEIVAGSDEHGIMAADGCPMLTSIQARHRSHCIVCYVCAVRMLRIAEQLLKRR